MDPPEREGHDRDAEVRKMYGTQVPVRPRFSRGQERRPHPPQEGAPRFSRGQEMIGPEHEKVHEGEFANGLERLAHHPETRLHGRFSRGQETEPEAQRG